MSRFTYTLPVEETRWKINGEESTTVLSWDYDTGRERLLNLYEKGKTKQWNATSRIDWSLDVDPANPLGMPDSMVPIFGSPVWNKLDPKMRAEVRRHLDSWRLSQFLHGEQGALVCASKIVQDVPDLDSKLYAATQVVDEARHVEAYARFIREKVGLAYPINANLRHLLNHAIADSRWDFTYLAMQVVIEGVALAAFGTMRDHATNPLGRALNAYVMEDEARHVAFGRLALRELYPQLTQKERDEREAFLVVACYHIRERFMADEVWDRLDLDRKHAMKFARQSPLVREFQRRLFSRIVPTIRDIGLWGPRLQKAFSEMGVIEFGRLDPNELAQSDEDIAAEFDRLSAERVTYMKTVADEAQ